MDKRIIWLEDRRETLGRLRQELGQKKAVVKLATGLFEFKLELATLEGVPPQDCLLIIDISLDGVRDLRDVGKPNVLSDLGIDAGLLLVEHVLDPEGEETPYSRMPILLFTGHYLDKDSDVPPRVKKLNKRRRKNGQPPVELLQKSVSPTFVDIKSKTNILELVETWVNGKWLL